MKAVLSHNILGLGLEERAYFVIPCDTRPRKGLAPQHYTAKISPARRESSGLTYTPRVRANPRRNRICTIKSRMWLFV